YNNRYEKATFFVFESRNASGLRGLSLAGNSYPYYQDKKKLVFNSFLKPKIQTQIPRAREENL
ncbi:TPA: hypothetical protein ACHVAU_002061, partial [Streptococcus suis]